MTTREDFPVALAPAASADEIRRSIGTLWDAVIPIVWDRDLLAVCAFSAVGLILCLAFAMAPA
ncbi:MAG TPA: hypothetical protein VH684_25855 [Xanthobacteraceae bacterium]|jgi:hypothetical protein